MSRKFTIPVIITFAMIVSACNLSRSSTPQAFTTETATNPPAATATFTVPAATSTPLPSNIPLPSATATNAPSSTPVPTATSTVSPAPIPTPSNFIDDRSTPSQVIVSLYNAINRREYLRAYDYWSNPANTLGSFNSYAAGYQDTASVDVVFGQITGDAGMSQVYYTVPVILKVTSKNGTRTNYAACYIVHKSSPDVFGAPPFAPMSINQGSAKVSDINTSDASALATACNGFPSGPMQVPVAGSTLNIDKANFLDNRSGPIETVSSFLNALNLKQYVRAYSYFQDPAAFPGPYGAWAAGYSNTGAITVTFGNVQSEGAAGSLYYKVPLAENVITTTGGTQVFVGCYTLRQVQPAVQATPPFRPIGIVSGKFNQVATGTDVNTLLGTACN